jgi:hypothetical protein
MRATARVAADPSTILFDSYELSDECLRGGPVKDEQTTKKEI